MHFKTRYSPNAHHSRIDQFSCIPIMTWTSVRKTNSQNTVSLHLLLLESKDYIPESCIYTEFSGPFRGGCNDGGICRVSRLHIGGRHSKPQLGKDNEVFTLDFFLCLYFNIQNIFKIGHLSRQCYGKREYLKTVSFLSSQRCWIRYLCRCRNELSRKGKIPRAHTE